MKEEKIILYNHLEKENVANGPVSTDMKKGAPRMDPIKQIEETEKAVNDFITTIEDLPEELFLRPMNGWSPRDVTAHLIGWIQHTIDGCRHILQGERPDYFEDADNNYNNLNAASVKTYASQNKINLLAECEDSFTDLKHYLQSLAYQQWVKDYGVRYRDWVITVDNTVLALQKDFENHREEIENWAQQQNQP